MFKKATTAVPHYITCPVHNEQLSYFLDNSCPKCLNIIAEPGGINHVHLNSSIGLKFDTDKPRMELLDPDFLEEVARVMTFGAKKYEAHNWRKGLAVSRLLGACLRHVSAVVKGEDTDPESGLSHTAHATCCLMFAFTMLKTRPDLDDRYKAPK